MHARVGRLKKAEITIDVVVDAVHLLGAAMRRTWALAEADHIFAEGAKTANGRGAASRDKTGGGRVARPNGRGGSEAAQRRR